VNWLSLWNSGPSNDTDGDPGAALVGPQRGFVLDPARPIVLGLEVAEDLNRDCVRHRGADSRRKDAALRVAKGRLQPLKARGDGHALVRVATSGRNEHEQDGQTDQTHDRQRHILATEHLTPRISFTIRNRFGAERFRPLGNTAVENPRISRSPPRRRVCAERIWHPGHRFDAAAFAAGGSACKPRILCIGADSGGLLFQNVTGTRFNFVPYRGAAPAVQDLVAGQIDLGVENVITSLPQIREGNIRTLAVTSKTHLAAAPEIPTVDEAGLPGFYLTTWQGVWGRRGIPQSLIAKLNSAIVTALAYTTVRMRLAELGFDIFPRDQQTPEALAAYQKAEIEKWWPIIRAAGIKAE
jgi:Tripartite tricarboxylate transporter family receptor